MLQRWNATLNKFKRLDPGWAAILAAVVTVFGTAVAGIVVYNVTIRDNGSSISTPAVMPTQTPTPRPASGLVFASEVDSDGRALNPGTTFPPTITSVYPVFRSDATPPGLVLAARNPIDGEYYAYVMREEGALTSSLGWRWYRDGQVVVDHQQDTQPGVTVWLRVFHRQELPMFTGDLADFSPGMYRVVILLGGNPALSGDLTITPD